MSNSAVAAATQPRPYVTQPDALFRAAADQAPQVMWIVKGAVTYLNHSWYELVGGTPPKWYGHEWSEVVAPAWTRISPKLMETQAALRYANQELEAFSYSVSHDLRTPLVTVQGFVRLLGEQLEAIGDTTVRHYLARITEAVNHMGRLVDGLLALSQVTRRKLQ